MRREPDRPGNERSGAIRHGTARRGSTRSAARTLPNRPVRLPFLALATVAGGTLAVAGVLALPPVPIGEPSQAVEGRPLRIVAVGDSITQGGRAGGREYTYRWPLARLLQDEGACVSFVGSHHDGLDPEARWPAPWDADHEGYYGATTDAVRERLAATLPTFAPPDLALVHLGTNDGRSRWGSDTVEPLRAIVALLRDANPRVGVLIAEPALDRVRAAVLVPRLRLLARELATPASPIGTVDLHARWVADPGRNDSDTFDGVHPNLRGQRRMAEAWRLAMDGWVEPPPTGDCPPA